VSILDDGMKFLEDLILGDFNEQQMVSAQVVAGLISLIPILDQVMDARDVSGCLYRINKHGGFAKATLEQKVDLGFAAFGIVPSIGSAFKTVFKPLYKQRKAAKGVINGGVAMIERMLDHKKGGAVRWVRALDWAGNTQAAIIQANLALESCIQLLEYLGQPHWWLPDRLEQLARDAAPGLRSLRGQLAAPIHEAAAEIRRFLEELLGEHAAAVAMAVAGNASVSRRGNQGSHGSPVARPNGARHSEIGTVPRTQARERQGRVANIVQRTAFEIYRGLDFAAKGLMGEHIVEHHIIEQKNWGLQWNRHDMSGPSIGGKAAGWQGEHRKLNDGGIPIYLCTPKAHALANGIDSLWQTNRPRPHEYAVVEAKANMNPNAQLYTLLGEARANPLSPSTNGARTRRQSRIADSGGPASAEMGEAPKSSMTMQMSHEWIRDRITKSFPHHQRRMIGNYSRHVFLVSPLQASEHVKAMTSIISEGLVDNPSLAQKHATAHATHDVQKEFKESDLISAERIYTTKGKYKRQTGQNLPKERKK
jgi:hypothetical protein